MVTSLLTSFAFKDFWFPETHTGSSIVVCTWHVVGQHVTILSDWRESICLAKTVLGLRRTVIGLVVSDQAECFLIGLVHVLCC